ncbi:heavy metal translocating P-type ATPase [Halovivax limisalsi]|uniref:heavy metal translocating P-type ATPase n=1 Tax=Halovivax limisalsi TaxID=1453760 RepID=UPI001FFC7C0E|nr:cation-translocating P-type ATPase [Halovivax limisalsi]
MAPCSLCGLPTPTPPVADADGEGSYCCRGCLEVDAALGGLDDVDRGDVRERTVEPGADDSAEPTIPDDADVAFFDVDGMHCATCEGFVALLAERVDGVCGIEVNYATETARVGYDPAVTDPESIAAGIAGHGYRARPKGESAADDDGADRSRAAEDDLATRLLVGGFLTFLIKPWYLFYFYPSYVGLETGILDVDATTAAGRYVPMVSIAVMTTIVLCYTGYPVLRGAYVSLRVRRPNMDLLVALAAVSAYGYSTLSLVTGGDYLYYDVTVAVVMVVSLGRYVERKRRRAATDRLSSLASARTDEARRLTPDGRTEAVSVDALEPGDVVRVKPGERIPIDGTVASGTAAVDESVLTGESLPRTTGEGDDVVGGSIVTDAPIEVTVGADAASTLDRIAELVWSVQSGTPGIQRFADRLATVFVPLVFTLSIGVTAFLLATGASRSSALLVGLAVLVVSCPCAMGLATPLAVASGLRDGLERGIVVANESLFESAPAIETVVFDKTGTLTTGEMTVRDVDPVAGETAEAVLERAAAVERYAEHPAANAIADYAADRGVDGPEPNPVPADEPPHSTAESAEKEAPPTRPDGGSTAKGADRSDRVGSITDFRSHPGEGVSALVDGQRVAVGTPDLVEREIGSIGNALCNRVEAVREAGHLPVVVGYDGAARGVIAVGDAERAEWDDVAAAVGDREVIVLTGDDERAAEKFSDHPAVDRVFAGVPPDGKVETIRRLSAAGPVAMVGDGTNDAPALGAADLSIAMGRATAYATDAADVVLTRDDLRDVPAVFDLAGRTRRRIRENVAWALTYNAVALPLAVTGLINPLFAAVAMASSSLFVVANSARSILDDGDE